MSKKQNLVATQETESKLLELRGLAFVSGLGPLPRDRLEVLLFVQLHHTGDLVAKTIERDLAKHGLSVARYAILRMLEDRNPVPLSWLAERHFSRRSNITAMVDRLVRDGLVERIPDEIDRRITRVRLTELGRHTVETARGPHLQFLAQVLSPLDDTERHVMINLLQKLSAPLEDADQAAQLLQDVGADFK
jgi:MarR family 2-MHQ and catechol resistance regulon transcriptional repressor